MPGLGLATERRGGAALAVVAGLGLGVAAAAPAIDPEHPLPWLLAGAGAWTLAGVAVLAIRYWPRREPDANAVRATYRAAAAAYLRNDLGGAEAHAAILCRMAPDEAGAWLLRARIAERSGRPHAALHRRAQGCAGEP